MKNQGPRFDFDRPPPRERPAVRDTDPDTSHAAFASVEEKVTERHRRIMGALAEARSGLTNSQLANLLGLERDSVSPRMAELASRGLVVDSGERRAWKTNRKQIVWVLANGESS